MANHTSKNYHGHETNKDPVGGSIPGCQRVEHFFGAMRADKSLKTQEGAFGALSKGSMALATDRINFS
jgi:hypothetical protein